MFWSLPTGFLSGKAAAGGIALINSLVNLGGYCSLVALGWLRNLTRRMDYGPLLLAGILGLAALLLSVLGMVTHLVPDRSERELS